MARLDTTYYKGTDVYSDGDVEDEILKLVEDGDYDIGRNSVSFPVLYHLSPVRENILNWYPFKKDASCLEIGAGCGAVTGLLCERLGSVTAVELSKKRSSINLLRNKRHDNLTIYVGNLHDIVFDKKFDYIVINGVFEYAMSFTDSTDPYQDFLIYAASLLEKGGRLLIAIENRLGLKYFAGAPEDHTDKYFDGLREYADSDSVRTFSKQEWLLMLKRALLEKYRFFYPYPDYKFPNEIFTDASLASQRYGKTSWNFTEHRYELFPEENMSLTLIKEGVMDRFVNSFLIEAGRADCDLDVSNILYAKLGADRNESFTIGTVLESDKVRKFPLSDKARKHLRKMQSVSGMILPGPYRYLSSVYDFSSGELTYEMLHGKSLMTYSITLVSRGEISALKNMIDHIYNSLIKSQVGDYMYHTAEFEEVFGLERGDEIMPCLNPANIDLILDNMFIQADNIYILDAEWVFHFPVPGAFVMWRLINDMYTHCPMLEKYIKKPVFFKEYGIDDRQSELYWKWSTHFVEKYVGANELLNCSCPLLGCYLEGFRYEQKMKDYFETFLYVDEGYGFSEETKLMMVLPKNAENFSCSFDVSSFSNIKELRWDPADLPCRFFPDLKESSGGIKFIPRTHVDDGGDGDLFLTNDPIYSIEFEDKVPDNITISGKIEFFDEREAFERFLEIHKAVKDRNILVEARIKELDEMIMQLRHKLEVANGTSGGEDDAG